MPRHSLKLTGKIADLVCELHAQGLNYTHIAKEVFNREGVQLHKFSVSAFLNRSANLPQIQQAVDRYRSNPLMVDIAHKRVRLEGMNRERLRILKVISRICGDKDGVLGDIPHKSWSKYSVLLKRLLEIYDRAMNEIEKKPEMVALFQNFVRTEVSDEDLRKQVAEIDFKLLELRRSKVIEAKSGELEGIEGEDTEQSS
jgi:hypothetical protein